MDSKAIILSRKLGVTWVWSEIISSAFMQIVFTNAVLLDLEVVLGSPLLLPLI